MTGNVVIDIALAFVVVCLFMVAMNLFGDDYDLMDD